MEREGSGEGAKFPQGGGVGGRCGGGEGKEADKIRGLECLFGEGSKVRTGVFGVRCDVVGGCRKIRGMKELGETSGEKRVNERSRNAEKSQANEAFYNQSFKQ